MEKYIDKIRSGDSTYLIHDTSAIHKYRFWPISGDDGIMWFIGDQDHELGFYFFKDNQWERFTPAQDNEFKVNNNVLILK